MEKYLVALGGVLGYFGLVFLYAVSAYLLVRSPSWILPDNTSRLPPITLS